MAHLTAELFHDSMAQHTIALRKKIIAEGSTLRSDTGFHRFQYSSFFRRVIGHLPNLVADGIWMAAILVVSALATLAIGRF